MGLEILWVAPFIAIMFIMVAHTAGNNTKSNSISGKKVAAAIIIILIMILGFASIQIVNAGERGVLLQFGAVQEENFGEGLHFVTPIRDDVIKMNVQTQKYEVDATASTKDLLDVATKVAVNFHLSPDSVNTIYQKIGLDYESTVIAPAVQEIVKATTAKYDAEELITHREAVTQEIGNALKERLAARDIQVETISIINFEFPVQFNQAITDKQTAVQKALEAQNKLEQYKFEAQQTVVKAQGDAQAIEIIQKQLQTSPEYIQYIAIQKWNGILPQVTGGAIPLVSLPNVPQGTIVQSP